MQVTPADKKRLALLRNVVAYHQDLYHTKDTPEITDEAYDSLVRELEALELLVDGTFSHVSNAVGGQVSNAFTKVTHTTKQWSFDKAFTMEEVKDWEVRLHKQIAAADTSVPVLTYIAEHKIDGLKLILSYKNGVLLKAVTRGDGTVGEDVTHTAQTLKDIPATLSSNIDIEVVGEVWLARKEFERINKTRKKNDEPLFANPRNAAAGSLRQLDPEVARNRNLSMYCYDIDFIHVGTTNVATPLTQMDELTVLKKLGFNVNPHAKICTSITAVQKFYNTWADKRQTLPYGVDGVVLKVNDIKTQNILGYTTRAPRFGLAIKFSAEQVTTVVEDIMLQVGRTGVVTPVACLTPVLVDGSTVARATLHNEDQIKRLDVRVGDTVILQKAGDIIPEVVAVVLALRPEKTKPYRFPKIVSECGGDGAIERIPGESAYRCVVLDSDFLHLKRLHYFVSKAGLNIDGVGPRIIDQLFEAGLIRESYDLFTLTVEEVEALPGFKRQAAQNVITAISNAKTQPLARLLAAFGINLVGEETARLITKEFPTLEALQKASVVELENIHGIGLTVAQSLHSWLALPHNKKIIQGLLRHLELIEPTIKKGSKVFEGKKIVLTGTLKTYSRDEAKELIREHGGTVASSVSKKTDYVVVGAEAGGKADEARALGVPLLTETELMALIA